MDLDDLEHNSPRRAAHRLAGGTWIALVAGFGGMRCRNDELLLRAPLPPRLSRIAFRMCYRGSRLAVTITADQTTYEVTMGSPLTITHHGKSLDIGTRPVAVPIPPLTAPLTPSQPPGREPPGVVP